MSDSFWTGGSDAYEQGIREHYDSRLSKLRKRRDETVGSERSELESEITQTETAYKLKLDSNDDLLF